MFVDLVSAAGVSLPPALQAVWPMEGRHDTLAPGHAKVQGRRHEVHQEDHAEDLQREREADGPAAGQAEPQLPWPPLYLHVVSDSGFKSFLIKKYGKTE